MKKQLLLLVLCIWGCLNAFSQATSLTVDCQTPGWLSSMINYGDQQTLVNLKVTGYINGNDLSFIGSLNRNQHLNGVINLEDVKIVGATNSDNNKLTQSYFGAHIQHLILPKSLVSATKCLTGATLDTLTIGGDSLPIIKSGMFYANIYSSDGIRFNKNVKHLILREGVTTILNRSFYNGNSYGANEEQCVFESISFPSSLVTIEEYAFYGCYALKIDDLTDNIEEIGSQAFQIPKFYSEKDTIILPSKLKTLYLTSFPDECFTKKYVYVPKSVETINCESINLFGAYENCYLHLANENPPTLISDNNYIYQYIVAYVPKNSVEKYKNAPNWQKTTILAEPNPAKSINIDQESIEIVKGTSRQLNAIVLPEDADDSNYTWSSSNSNVATVSSTGLVNAITSGEAKIFATLNIDKTIIDSCLVKVYQPVTDIKLNITEKSVRVGETFNIKATITPSDADNKNIIWTSEDSEIASVENGKVTAIKGGNTWIKAISEDNFEAMDSCYVTVIQPVTGIKLDETNIELGKIGEMAQLHATVLPEDASNKGVKWFSTNTSVCTVSSSGIIVAVGFGSSVVTATTEEGGFVAVCIVNVIDKMALYDLNSDGKISAGHHKGYVKVLSLVILILSPDTT